MTAGGAAHPLPSDLAFRVCDWQRIQGRQQLPWQHIRDPYRVWLSEIMLQQTQVTTVLSYYARFLERFPNVAELAAASLDEVLAAWSGLGYYSRARNLHRCAQTVMDAHGGQFPATAAGLNTLPGIGRSTAAAIAAFCFGERVAILDGNVKRVLTRVAAFGGDLATAHAERQLWALAEAALPQESQDMSAYTQGLMDLGATVCAARRPQCLICPLQDICRAKQEGRPQDYPVKTRKLKRSQRQHWWLGLIHNDSIWLQQRPAVGVWAGLWSLPLLDNEIAVDSIKAHLGQTAFATLPTVEHALTHFDWTLHPRCAVLGPRQAEAVAPLLGPGRWVSLSEPDIVALPAPLKKWIPVAAAWARALNQTPRPCCAKIDRPVADALWHPSVP